MLKPNVVTSLAVILTLGAALGSSRAQNSASASIPDFSGMAVGWLAMGTDFKQAPGAPPMVTNDDAHPHVGNGGGRPSSFRFADLNNPNLTEFAKASLKKTNDEVLRGKAVFSREARCWPTGVPTYDLNQAQPVYIVQTPKEVVIMWQMDHQIRHVYLDVPHSKNPKPSWYGELVGHYEGDTLVVDTIGQNTETFVDNYRTPHSEKLHVTERFHLVEGGKTLQADITIEDPVALAQPLHVMHQWRKVQGPMTESRCAEGESFNPFGKQAEPIPTASKFDF